MTQELHQRQFISGRESKMDGVRFEDITECGSCGLPWATDSGRHRTALRRGMRVFICDPCREAQIS